MVSDKERDEFSEYRIELDSSAEITLDGKYRCRECGKVFDTREAHDDHYRDAHVTLEVCLSQGMAM